MFPPARRPSPPPARPRRIPPHVLAFLGSSFLLGATAAPSGLAAQEPETGAFIPIASVRADADGDGIPDRLGDTVTISGRATTAGTVLNADQVRIFIQDGSAGVMLFSADAFGASGGTVARGDSVVATGTVDHYEGLTQIALTEYRVVPAPPREPEPVDLPPDPATFEQFEGSLVRARGFVMGSGGNAGGTFLLLGPEDAGEPAVSVFVARDHRAPPQLERFRVGDRVEVTGPLGQFDREAPYDQSYQIYPRSPDEISFVGVSPWQMQRLALVVGGLLLLALVGLILLRREVRERTRALSESERAARNSQERLSFFLDHAPVVLFTVDRELRITWLEGRGLTDLGVSQTDLLGRTVPELMGIDDPESPPLPAYRRALEGEAVQYDADWGGRTWHTHLRPLVEDGRVTGVVAAAQDATEHRETERRLEEQSAHFQRLFEESPEAIVLVDENDTVLQVNPEFETLFGYSADEAVGRTINDLIAVEGQEDEAAELTHRVARGDRIEVEAVRRHRDGTPIHVSILATPVHVGGETRVYGIYRDVTEQKLLEEQLLHSQRLEAVGQLAGGIAHDFNNILTAILGHTRVLLEEVGDDERLRDDLEQIATAGERAAQLTRQLLTFSRRDVISTRLVDLDAVVREARTFLGRLIEERVELRFELHGDLPPVEADPGRLEQILMNLVINARDATEGGGRVTVSTGRRTSCGGETDSGAREEDWVVLEVLDEGRGMREQERARMFEPFFTTKAAGEGTGLGLSMVYGIVEQAGGSIEVDTEPGAGTSVRVCLPAALGEVSEEVAAPPDWAGGPSGAGEEVLLVDDDRPVREVTRRILERAGFTVFAAESGEAALRYCDSRSVPPHAVLSDIVMPGMTGYQLVDELRRRYPEIKVLLMTGYTEDAFASIDRGDELLHKPYDARTLVRRLREKLADA